MGTGMERVWQRYVDEEDDTRHQAVNNQEAW